MPSPEESLQRSPDAALTPKQRCVHLASRATRNRRPGVRPGLRTRLSVRGSELSRCALGLGPPGRRPPELLAEAGREDDARAKQVDTSGRDSRGCGGVAGFSRRQPQPGKGRRCVLRRSLLYLTPDFDVNPKAP